MADGGLDVGVADAVDALGEFLAVVAAESAMTVS
jgi:hypothetical protein